MTIGASESEANTFARLFAGRALRNRRMRRLLMAHLVREEREAGGEEGDEYEGYGGEEGDEDRKLVRALIASGVLRRRRIRRALVAHLLRERGEQGDIEDEGEDYEETGGEGRDRLVRALIASGLLRNRRRRRMLLAHLRRERGEEEDEGFEGIEGGEDEEDSEDDRRIMRALAGVGIARRRRRRRAAAFGEAMH